jgi:soluble P-type ATPase
MIIIQRPGQEPLEIENILIDFEGTLAQDRRVNPKAKDRINLLSKRTKIYIFAIEDKDVVEKVLKNIKAELIFLKEGESSQGKLNLLRELRAEKTVFIGNGKDDEEVMEYVAFGISVIGKEGASVETIKRADILFFNMVDALEFLLKPLRQKATLGK